MSTTTIFAVIVAISNALVAVFSYILAVHNTRNDKNSQKQQKKEEAQKELKDVCDKGSMSDLLDIAKKIGDLKK